MEPLDEICNLLEMWVCKHRSSYSSLILPFMAGIKGYWHYRSHHETRKRSFEKESCLMRFDTGRIKESISLTTFSLHLSDNFLCIIMFTRYDANNWGSMENIRIIENNFFLPEKVTQLYWTLRARYFTYYRTSCSETEHRYQSYVRVY